MFFLQRSLEELELSRRCGIETELHGCMSEMGGEFATEVHVCMMDSREFKAALHDCKLEFGEFEAEMHDCWSDMIEFEAEGHGCMLESREFGASLHGKPSSRGAGALLGRRAAPRRFRQARDERAEAGFDSFASLFDCCESSLHSVPSCHLHPAR